MDGMFGGVWGGLGLGREGRGGGVDGCSGGRKGEGERGKGEEGKGVEMKIFYFLLFTLFTATWERCTVFDCVGI